MPTDKPEVAEWWKKGLGLVLNSIAESIKEVSFSMEQRMVISKAVYDLMPLFDSLRNQTLEEAAEALDDMYYDARSARESESDNRYNDGIRDSQQIIRSLKLESK